MDVRRRVSFNMNTGSGEPIIGPINTDNYLTILALENGLTASLSTNACQYCVDGDGNWIDLPAGTATQAINQGQTLSFKGNLTPNPSNGIGTFTVTKKCNLEGNCMSVLFGDDAVNNYSLNGKQSAFFNLFKNCTALIEVSETFLPATTLAGGCYYSMFYGCTSLTTAPELPATTLKSICYSGMFYGCTSLTTAPELPAIILDVSCYHSMFYDCTSLRDVPKLPATTLKDFCYSSMFRGCTRLTTAPTLPATTLCNNCYSYMFQSCTSLTTAPELPATTLAEDCYSYMFMYCSKLTTAPLLPAIILAENCYRYMFHSCSILNYIKMLATDISATGCLNNWVYGVSSTGTFVKHPDMTSLPTGNNGIPSGWRVADYTGEVITFTINGVEYQAEEGMTWQEWCDSGYNVDGFWCDSGYVRPAGATVAGIQLESPLNVIINGMAYSTASLGGGAD